MREPYPLLHQVLVDVQQPAAREDLVELVLQQLVHAGAAGHDHGLDVHVVQRIGHAVEQHPVLGRDLLTFAGQAGRGLRITAAQIAGRQHGLRAGLVEHRQGGQADVREQTFRAAARKIEHRIRLVAQARAVADDRDHGAVFKTQFGTVRAFRQFDPDRSAYHFDRGIADLRSACRRLGYVARAAEQPGLARHVVRIAQALEAPFQHALAHHLDGARVGGIEELHRRPGAGVETLLAALGEDLAHAHGHVAEVDVDRAGRLALVAHGAVVGDVVHLVEVFQRDAAPGLFLVQEGLDHQAGAENLVAR